MTRDEYANQVEAVLTRHTAPAVKKLEAIFDRIPADARRIEIRIFVDKDGEGLLDVRVSPDGPDLFVLNKKIDADAELFATRMTERGLVPSLPLIAGSAEEFSVHDTLTDCAASWIATVWRQADTRSVQIPVTVLSQDDYGSITPFDLSPRRRAMV